MFHVVTDIHDRMPVILHQSMDRLGLGNILALNC
jgi:hypothetical protein